MLKSLFLKRVIIHLRLSCSACASGELTTCWPIWKIETFSVVHQVSVSCFFEPVTPLQSLSPHSYQHLHPLAPTLTTARAQVRRFSTDRLAAHFLLILRGALAPQSAASFKFHHGATAAAPFGTLSVSPSACGAKALRVGAIFRLSFYLLASCARSPSLPQGQRSHPPQI